MKVQYSKPIRPPKTNEKKGISLRQILDKLKTKKDSKLQNIYKQKYEEVYNRERAEYLKKKAEGDAKKAANRDTSFFGFIAEVITGGRNK